MPKYRVSWTEIATYVVRGLVEADDEDQAQEIAFSEGYDFRNIDNRVTEVNVEEETEQPNDIHTN